MVNDMERSRDGYRGRYRDRHNNNNNGLTNRHNHEDRSTRGNYHGHSTHDNNHNGNYSSRNSSNSSYNYRSSRTSFNSRPVISRNNSSTNYHNDDDYHHHHHPRISSSSNRRNSGNSSQSNYYENSSPSSRFDRSSNHREIYPSLLDEQPILPNAPLPTNSLYYSSSSISYPRDRNLPLPSTQYIESDRNRYMHLSNRRDSPSSSSPASSYRNERSMDYGSRTTNNDIYMRGEYRLPSPPSLVPLSTRADPYDDIYRANDYGNRSERYDIPFNRTNISSREYSNYRNSSNVSMSSSSPSSSYISREQYPSDVAYRSTSSQSRDYENPSSRLIDNQESLSRNSRDRNHMDYHSSYHDRPNLKRSASRYNDNGPIPSKRPMRR